MATDTAIAETLKLIAAAYPGRFNLGATKEERTFIVSTWAAFVRDIPDDLLKNAAMRFISANDSPFPPTIPEIRRVSAQIQREILDIPTEWEAWSELLDAPMPSPYRKFRDGKFVDDEDYQWPHEIVGTVARRLGWPTRFPKAGDEVADRAHFTRAYESEIEKRMQVTTQVPQVTRYIEERRLELTDGRAALEQERRRAFDTGEDLHKLTARLEK